MSIASQIQRINDEVSTQAALIAQIAGVLEGKAAGGGETATKKTVSITITGAANSGSEAHYIDENGSAIQCYAGETIEALGGLIFIIVLDGEFPTATGNYVDGSLALEKTETYFCFLSDGGTLNMPTMGGAG